MFITLILIVTSVVGGVVMSVCGFGFGAVAMSVLPYFLPYQQAVSLAALSGSFTALMICVPNHKYINWRILAPCAIVGVIAARAAVMMSISVSGGIMMKALGAALVAIAVYSVFFGDKIHIRPTVASGAVAGLLGGAMSGLFAVGGPPIAVYMLACTDDNDVYRSTISAHFFATTIVSTLTRWQNGIITMHTLNTWLIMLAGILLGIFLGNRIFHRLNARRLRLCVYTYLAFSGLTMLVK